MFQKMSLAAKLLSAFVVIAAITALVGVVGILKVNVLGGVVSDLGGNYLPSVQNLQIINEAQTAIDGADKALLCTKLDEAMIQDRFARIDGAKARVDEAWKVYDGLPKSTAEGQAWEKVQTAWDAWWADHEAYLAFYEAWRQNPTDAAYDQMVK